MVSFVRLLQTNQYGASQDCASKRGPIRRHWHVLIVDERQPSRHMQHACYKLAAEESAPNPIMDVLLLPVLPKYHQPDM
jgi:hypothetical protein